MKLSHYTLKNISNDGIILPGEVIFGLPEKVLQFGTGMLLRGLPDYYIDKANRQGIFNGRIVVVKSTAIGDASVFKRQDGLYTICERGIVKSEKFETNIVSSSISRVLIAQNQWDEILECAHNPLLRIIISNTTEMGIQLVNEDIRHYPPISFPGKLLSFLYERFLAFEGAADTGFVILPTELLPENGKRLEAIVLELAHLNGLDSTFIEWLGGANYFCNSLVDRIVTGMPSLDLRGGFFEALGYEDDLLTVTEVYNLWAIEGGDHIKEILSFHAADPGVKIEPDINLHRELKLRLLNGTHTFVSGIAFLAGIPTVREAMENDLMLDYIRELTTTEISASIPYIIKEAVKAAFALAVMDRFRNPHIQHHWKTIAQNYSQKMKLRCVPLLIQHYKENDWAPGLMAFGFAAYLQYMKVVKNDQTQYFGKINEDFYLIDDAMASFYYNLWEKHKTEKVVHKALSNTTYWGIDLSLLPGFSARVLHNLNAITGDGIMNAMEIIMHKK